MSISLTSRPSTKTVLIFGGHGRTAQALTKQLVERSYTVYSLIRTASQIPEIEKLGAKPVVQDLEHASILTLQSIIDQTGATVLVWAAQGAYGVPGSAERIDHQAAIRTYFAAAASKVGKRVIVISALDVRDRSRPTPSWYGESERKGSERLWQALGPYMEAKLAADRFLVTNGKHSGLKYTIVRPAGLLDAEKAEGTVLAGRVHWDRNVSRGDVAGVMVACIENDDTENLAFDVIGGDAKITREVAKVGEQRVDCFNGYY